MKRLIDEISNPDFVSWVKQHNSQEKWDFDNPKHLVEQFIRVVSESGDIDLKTLFAVFMEVEGPNMSNNQFEKFSTENY